MSPQLNGNYIPRTYRKINYKHRRIIFFSLILAILGTIIMAVFLPNGKIVKPYNTTGLVIGGEIINTETPPIIEGNSILVSFVDMKKIDKNIFYDNKFKKVIITTNDKVIKIKADKNTGVVNNKQFALSGVMKVQNDIAYIPIQDFKEIYNIDVNYYKENNVVVIDNKAVETKVASIKSNAKDVRKAPSIKQPILKKVNKDEKVRVYEQVENWYKVRTGDGTVGYIPKKYLTKVESVPGYAAAKNQYQPWRPQNGKINLVWDQIERVTPPMDNVEKAEGLDVVSPTWFQIIDGNGSMKNKADFAYIKWAKANGYKIWPLVNNLVSNDQSNKDMTSKFLNNSDAREKVINELLSYAQMYDFDGINIDFEYVNVKDKEILNQFMRELAPMFREKGLVVSIDVTVKVQSDNSLFFDRKTLADIVDYVILMSYDQHWSTSQVSGSVAQYSWMEANIKELLSEIPKEKFIMGVPFYIRQWKEENSKVSSTAISMAKAQNIIRQSNAKVTWDAISGQNYAEYVIGNAKYKIWVEDAKSIDLKSSLALKYDIAGVASWRRGYETSDIWGVLKRNLKDIKSYTDWEKK